jgi:hypothetical protein
VLVGGGGRSRGRGCDAAVEAVPGRGAAAVASAHTHLRRRGCSMAMAELETELIPPRHRHGGDMEARLLHGRARGQATPYPPTAAMAPAALLEATRSRPPLLQRSYPAAPSASSSCPPAAAPSASSSRPPTSAPNTVSRRREEEHGMEQGRVDCRRRDRGRMGRLGGEGKRKREKRGRECDMWTPQKLVCMEYGV